MKEDHLLSTIDKYYSDKIKLHGPTSKGVDWNAKESQYLRFAQLTKLIPSSESFNLLDYGCGYGELFNYLENHFNTFEYTGFDISTEMIKQGKSLFNTKTNITWISSLASELNYDYTIASGIFNVKLNNSDEDWLEYVFNTLKQINEISLKGFAFNMLTSYSDKDLMKQNLYYASPEHIFRFCKLNFSRNVALLHNYGLYEFTVIVNKNIK